MGLHIIISKSYPDSFINVLAMVISVASLCEIAYNYIEDLPSSFIILLAMVVTVAGFYGITYNYI